MQFNNMMYPQNLNQQKITQVNGKAGAEMYQLAPNSSIILLDESAPLIWVKTTDGAGYPTLTPYAITRYEEPKPVDIQNLEARLTKLEEQLNEQSDNLTTGSKTATSKPRKNQTDN